MQTLKQAKQQISDDPQNWAVYLMDFVDDFRYYREPQRIAEPFTLSDERMDALLAATAEQLCAELKIERRPGFGVFLRCVTHGLSQGWKA